MSGDSSARVMIKRMCVRIVQTGVVLALVAGGTLAGAGQGEERYQWSQWRGPNRDGVSSETGLLKQWPAGGPALVWTAEGCGRGYSSVAVADGMVYTAGIVGDETCVVAFDLDGQPRWRAANGRPWRASPRQRWAAGYYGTRGTPTVDDGLVYHLGDHGRLAALDAKTGKEAWSLNVLEQFEGQVPFYGLAESLLVDGRRLIVCPGGPKGYIVALDKKTGQVIWANADIADDVSYCSPIIVDSDGARQIITMTGQAVIGVNPDTGALLWRYEHGNGRKISATTPVYREERVFATAGYGAGSVLLRLAAEGGAVSATRLWASRAPDNQHDGVVLVNGFVYGAGHQRKGWFCLDFKTGKEMFQSSSLGRGSVIAADGMLYCLDEKGKMALVEATSDELKIVSDFQVPRGGEGAYWSHPAICGGRLYVRHGEKLYAYNISAK